MKFFKKQFLIALVLLMPLLTFATSLIVVTAIQEEPEITFLSVVSAGAISILLQAILLAMNHVVAGTFDKDLWWADSMRPALWTFLIYVALGAIDLFVPFLDNLVEMTFQVQTTAANSAALVGVAYVVFPIIKGLFKRKATQEKASSTNKALKLREYKN